MKELRWDEAWSVKSVVWSVGREKCSVKSEVWSVKCEVWNVKKAVRSVKCELWTVKCELWSVECEVWGAECEVWSVKCEVWSVKSAVRSVKGEVELQMWHVKRDTTFAECTRARTWLAHGACKFYRWETFLYIPKATSAPPRAGTTGINWHRIADFFKKMQTTSKYHLLHHTAQRCSKHMHLQDLANWPTPDTPTTWTNLEWNNFMTSSGHAEKAVISIRFQKPRPIRKNWPIASHKYIDLRN